ncbi:hypothetical protein OCAE111667_08915 [Occultella aeris]|uniref:Uncharacterized protein n=1 Tax=Occultella aeris TaxID=2761496 RepID=A0A7M4DJZ3_9MICO|nr:hypothetical protein [Occultella aeris]VZO37380.1 hypothetical protein HALOF300_02455 [Occultella aeris]
MASVEVVPADLAAAAARLEEAREGVASVRTADDLATVTSALAGAESARAAEELATAWKQRFRAWDTAAQNQIEAMGVSAQAYEEQDGEGATAFNAISPPLGAH